LHSGDPASLAHPCLEQQYSSMQCADLLDKHVGSIAELPTQSNVSVVPPGLRQVALFASVRNDPRCCLASVTVHKGLRLH
jgi:hypothetical protein